MKFLSQQEITDFRFDYGQTSIIILHNYVTLLQEWLKCLLVSKDKFTKEEELGIALFREWLGDLVALEILFSKGLFRSAFPTYRAMFEVFVQFLFYIDERSEVNKKYQCYHLIKIQKQFQYHKKFLDKGIEIKKGEKVLNDIRKKIEVIEISFNEDESDLANDVRQQLETDKIPINWYQLYDKKLNNLAKLGKKIVGNDGIKYVENMYFLMYDLLSQKSHGIDAEDNLAHDEEGKLHVLDVGNPFVNYYLLNQLKGMFNLFVPKFKQFFSPAEIIFKVEPLFTDEQDALIEHLKELQKFYEIHQAEINYYT